MWKRQAPSASAADNELSFPSYTLVYFLAALCRDAEQILYTDTERWVNIWKLSRYIGDTNIIDIVSYRTVSVINEISVIFFLIILHIFLVSYYTFKNRLDKQIKNYLL